MATEMIFQLLQEPYFASSGPVVTSPKAHNLHFLTLGSVKYLIPKISHQFYACLLVKGCSSPVEKQKPIHLKCTIPIRSKEYRSAEFYTMPQKIQPMKEFFIFYEFNKLLYFSFKGQNELFVFMLTKNNATLSPGLSVNGSIICSGLHFSRHRFNMTKILFKFGQQQLVMVNYACGFSQSKTGKYFE